MNVKFLASGVAALAMLAIAGTSNPAEARHGGHGMGGGRGWAPHFSGARFAGPHHLSGAGSLIAGSQSSAAMATVMATAATG